MICLSADNKLESFIVNIDKPESILKKLTKHTKKSLKRSHQEANIEEDETKVDKEII